MARRKKKTEIKKVVLYLRVSTVEQAEKDLSLPAQLRSVKDYADRKGYEVVQVYEEAGASGTDDNRPVFKRMIGNLLSASCEVDAVLVFQTSRFMRNATKARIAKENLKKNGVRVIAISQETTDDPAGQLMEGVFELMDQWESEVNGIRTRNALEENARKGHFNGSQAPFGFKIEKTLEGKVSRGKLVPNIEEVPTHNEVFREYISLLGGKTTARSLNKRGLTYRGKPWSKDKVMKVIGETASIGIYYWGKKEAKTGLWRDKEDWIAVPVQAIIDDDLFRMAQQVRESRDPDKNVGRNGSSPLLLAGMVRCGKCGASFQLESSGKLSAAGLRPYRYYNCRTFTRIGKEECSGTRIPTEKLEKAVLEHIAGAVFTEEVCQTLIEDLVEETGVLREKTAIQRKAFRKELAEVERRQARWQEAFENDELPADLGIERLKELKTRKAELEESLSKVVPLRPPPYLYTQANIQRFQSDLKDIFLAGKTSMTKNYLKFLVEEIVVTDDRLEISLKPRSALAMMSAEARKTKSETSFEAPDSVLTSGVSWLPLVDEFRTLCVAPTLGIKVVFEGLSAVAA